MIITDPEMNLSSNDNVKYTDGFQCHLYFTSSGLVVQSAIPLGSFVAESSAMQIHY
jgi:hypothetical protein